MHPDDILATYDRQAAAFDRDRGQDLVERRWLDRALSVTTGRRVLDLGCGTGRPIARYLTDRRCAVTGVDGAAAMTQRFQANLPRARVYLADMRGLYLGESFDILVAWNSFFHLTAADQRAMFPVFATHAAPGAALLFTAGPEAGEVLGRVGSEEVYHASLAPEEYRALLGQAGFDVVEYRAEDPACRGHTVWLARKRAATA